jgi:hypothetical protein
MKSQLEGGGFNHAVLSCLHKIWRLSVCLKAYEKLAERGGKWRLFFCLLVYLFEFPGPACQV